MYDRAHRTPEAAGIVIKQSRKFASWRPRVVNHRSSDGGLLLYVMKEKHFAPTEIAELWGVSPDLVRDLFRKEPGVLRLERPGTRFKRSYSTLRIPESVLDRVYTRLSSGS